MAYVAKVCVCLLIFIYCVFLFIFLSVSISFSSLYLVSQSRSHIHSVSDIYTDFICFYSFHKMLIPLIRQLFFIIYCATLCLHLSCWTCERVFCFVLLCVRMLCVECVGNNIPNTFNTVYKLYIRLQWEQRDGLLVLLAIKRY